MKMQDKTLPWSHTTSAVFALRWSPANSAHGNSRGNNGGDGGTKLAGITGSRVTTEGQGESKSENAGSWVRVEH